MIFFLCRWFDLCGMNIAQSPTIQFIDLPCDLIAKICDHCLFSIDCSVPNGIVLQYPFYKQVPGSSSNFDILKNMCLESFRVIKYCERLHKICLTLQLISHYMKAFSITYFNSRIRNKPINIDTSLYLIYLAYQFEVCGLKNIKDKNIYNLLTSPYVHNALLDVCSLSGYKGKDNLHITCNMYTKKLCINAFFSDYFSPSVSDRLLFVFKRCLYKNKRLTIEFPAPIDLWFDDRRSYFLSTAFYRQFLISYRSATKIKHYIDRLVEGASCTWEQDPPSSVTIQYGNVNQLDNVHLRVAFYYDLKPTVDLPLLYQI